MLGFKLTHVSKRDPKWHALFVIQQKWDIYYVTHIGMGELGNFLLGYWLDGYLAPSFIYVKLAYYHQDLME